ncbi:MAG: sensor protein KdpD [Chitinophagaceae bacterium]|nr:sensor protein KdpD [Chitinophagaceae bacterium]
MPNDKANSTRDFLDLIQKSRRGRFKIYIGMSAGVGKTYRMLQEAHSLLRNGVDVKIGYIETHGREETQALLAGLPEIPRRKLFYRGKELEEMDTDAIITLRPEVVLVDELAHTNIEGSRNEKRWQDVMNILDEGINVISAMNIQHIESLNQSVKEITGIEVAERVPDSILKQADEVVNIDLTADDLITRLKEGKIYKQDKIQTALNNFFKSENILHLRELALKEVASAVERKVDKEYPRQAMQQERFLACISSNEKTAKNVIRKTARLAGYYYSKWFVLFVETPAEAPDKIPLDKQRYLINHFQLATELGAEIIKVKSDKVSTAIAQVAEERKITTICIGKPHLNLVRIIMATNVFNELLKKLASNNVDLVILS